MVIFYMQHLWMLRYVVVVLARFVQQCCPLACALVRFAILNTLQQGGQTHATCYVETLRSLGPGLANAGPTMLRDVVSIQCCSLLAEA